MDTRPFLTFSQGLDLTLLMLQAVPFPVAPDGWIYLSKACKDLSIR